MKKIKKIRQTAISLLALFSVISALALTGALNWAENKAYDTRMAFSSAHFSPSEEISLVLLDQESLDWAKSEFGWGWPWPREAYAKMVDYFNRAGAASFAFDMIYSEPSVYGEQDDEKFAESSKNFGRVIQTVFYENDESEPTLPILALRDSAALLGNVSSSLDSDRVARRNPVEPSKNGEYGLSISSFLIKNGTLDFDSIPRARQGGMYIRYAKDLNQFVPYSAKQILQSGIKLEENESANGAAIPSFALHEVEGSKSCLENEISPRTTLGRNDNSSLITSRNAIEDENFIPPEQFKDSYIFFGLYAPGLFDICATPVSATYPGVGVHLCQLDTILQQNYLCDVPIFVTIFLALLCVFGGFFLGRSIRQAKISSLVIKTAVALAIVAAYSAFSYALFVAGWILPFATPIFAFVLSYITAIFEGYMTEGHQKRYLKAAFKQYLSPAVIENLIENPEMLNLGGEEREITAYFSDVQGFTSIS